MAKVNTNVHAYAGTLYAVWSAPLGTTLPATLPGTAPASPFAELGFLSETGLVKAHTTNDTNVYDMAGTMVRVIRSQEANVWTFEAIEYNAAVAGLLYPNSTVTTAAGVNTRVVGPATGRNLRAFVLDRQDGAVHYRHTIASGEAVQSGSVSYTGNGIAVYQFTLNEFLDSTGHFSTIISDDPADVAA